MKNFRHIFQHARFATILFAVAVLMCVGSVAVVSQLNERAAGALAQNQSALQTTVAQIQTLNGDLESIEAHLTGFKHLAELGLVGTPLRERWVESLETLHRQSGLPSTLRYTLSPPQPHTIGASPVQTDLSSAEALDHDLQFELSEIHEGEFLGFTDKLAAEWLAPFRFEKCEMSRDEQQWLKTSCTIRLFSIPLPQTAEPTQ